MNKPRVNIGLCNPKSPNNVSSIMRSSGNFQVEEIFYTGSRYPRALKFNPDLPKMSRSVGLHIPVTGVNCITDHIPQNMKIVSIEFAENATSLIEYQHPENAFYIFGPEDGSIRQKIINQSDDVVFIPTIGCMNLAASVNVVLYDRLVKSSPCFDNNELIQKNRCTNNNIKVRKKGHRFA